MAFQILRNRLYKLVESNGDHSSQNSSKTIRKVSGLSQVYQKVLSSSPPPPPPSSSSSLPLTSPAQPSRLKSSSSQALQWKESSSSSSSLDSSETVHGKNKKAMMMVTLSVSRELENKKNSRLRNIVLFRKFQSKIRKLIVHGRNYADNRSRVISYASNSICKRVFYQFRTKIQSKKIETNLVNKYIYRKKCSEALVAFSAMSASSAASKEMYLFSDIFRIKFLISRAIKWWRDRYCRNVSRIKARSSELFSSIYFNRRHLAVAMIYFKTAVAKPTSYASSTGIRSAAKSIRKDASA